MALFVFCGCSWCYAVAREWAAAQRSGALSGAARVSGEVGPGPAADAAPPLITLVAGSGMEAKGCRNFAAHTGLDPAQTILLPDPDRTVAEAYHAEPCPRVYVIDEGGTIRYINQGKDDGPRKAPAAVIVAHALAAMSAGAR